jgi:hypothetical protein
LLEELTAELGRQARILMLGCGNSQLSEVVSAAADFTRRLFGVEER